MSQPPQLTRSTPKMRVPRPGLPWRRIFVTLVCLLVLAAAGWAVVFCLGHALFNISVAGTRVDGKTLPEIETETSKATAKLEIQFKDGAKIVSPKLDEIGARIDTQATAQKAFEARRGQQFFEDIQLWQTFDVPLQLKVDEKKLAAYLEKTFGRTYRAPTPPSLKYNQQVEQFDIVPSRDGAGFDVPGVSSKVQMLASRPRLIEFAATREPVKSLVTDATAVYTQDEADKRVRLRLDFPYQDKLVYFPEPNEIASWLTFRPNENTQRLDIVYDKQKIASSLRTKITNSLNHFFGPDSAEAMETDAKLEITDVNALAEDVIDALAANESMEKEVEVTTIGSASGEVAP